MSDKERTRDALDFLHAQATELGQFHVEFRIEPIRSSGVARDNFESVLDRWFGGPWWRTSGHALELIGTDWSGGIFCAWRYPELGDRPPPIVYLGSEGQALAVVAKDLAAFVELLATGRVWGHYDDGRFDDDEHPKEHALFAAAASRRFGFTPRAAETIQREGAAAHLDFSAWVKMQIA